MVTTTVSYPSINVPYLNIPPHPHVRALIYCTRLSFLVDFNLCLVLNLLLGCSPPIWTLFSSYSDTDINSETLLPKHLPRPAWAQLPGLSCPPHNTYSFSHGLWHPMPGWCYLLLHEWRLLQALQSLPNCMCSPYSQIPCCLHLCPTAPL